MNSTSIHLVTFCYLSLMKAIMDEMWCGYSMMAMSVVSIVHHCSEEIEKNCFYDCELYVIIKLYLHFV